VAQQRNGSELFVQGLDGNAATGQLLGTVADLNWNVLDGLETGDLLSGGNGANRLIGTIRSDVLF